MKRASRQRTYELWANIASDSVPGEGNIETKYAQSVGGQYVRRGQYYVNNETKHVHSANEESTQSSQHPMRAALEQNTYVLLSGKASDSVSIRRRGYQNKGHTSYGKAKHPT
jgi:hypothetical protein